MGDQNVYPGLVDNRGLLKDGDALALKEHLIDELDYILLPTPGWNKLLSWYGLTENQEPIIRKFTQDWQHGRPQLLPRFLIDPPLSPCMSGGYRVAGRGYFRHGSGKTETLQGANDQANMQEVVEQGIFVKHCKVEVYLTELKLCEDRNMESVVTKRFSKADTIDTIEKEMRKLFSIPDERETRLWNKYMSNTFEPLSKPDSTIQDAGLYQGQSSWDILFLSHRHGAILFSNVHKQPAVALPLSLDNSGLGWYVVSYGTVHRINEYTPSET
ncbi:hypothetical protein AAFF_G00386250 [Aldrovandia affinis]|uniref:ubiquitinyl hydrolase 1 n=1 Tax=Aldrovandia affinis TaxID=143900 RepID=A0AAD7SF01_9TELE|nr:hypothetical protein AAFF_G00386250 [Aldrovandia affinis]